MVKTGRGGGLEGNGGQGTRNKALDTGIFRPLGPKKAQTLNKSLAPTLDIKKKINKPKTVNKSLVPNSPSVINPASTPDSGGSMFESETGEEEPDDKDKPKDKEKTTKKPIPIYAMEEGEVPGDWSEEDYSYEETNTASAKKAPKNKSLTPISSSVVNPASAPESGGSMFESETGEEEPKDKDKGKRLPAAHFKLSNNFCLLSALSCFAFSGKDNNVEEGEAETTPGYTGVEVELNIHPEDEDYDYKRRRRKRH